MTAISLSRITDLWASRKPDALAVTHGDAQLTWRELDARVRRTAACYAARGVEHDDRVSIALPNGIEFVVATLAAWKLGASPHPMSSGLTPHERLRILALARPKLLVGGGPDDGVDRWLPQGFIAPDLPPDVEFPEKTAVSTKAMTSGGSTGDPKLIVSRRPAVWDPDEVGPGFHREGCTLIPGPFYHQGPFTWGFAGLFTGSHLVITSKFEASETLALLERHRVTMTCLVPTMMQRILDLPAELRASTDVSSLRSLWHLGAPCPDWVKQAYIDWLGPEVVWELYGGTESIGTTIIRGDEWLQHRGSVGRPAATCEIRIVGDDGHDLPPGEAGEIFLRPRSGPGSTYRYIGAEARRLEGGWESLGDIGYLDADGYLYINDRRADMILSGGANIFPAEIEAALDEFPGVRSSAVIGLPHVDLGSAVHAIVDCAGAPPPDAERLMAHLRTRLSKPKLPRTFEFVDTLLRDEAGKVRRRALREARIRTS
ncbi:MAG: bile acid-coenzyme ligase [Actinomycetota bacterium]|jgi:bile acid-coenzyme A ligase